MSMSIDMFYDIFIDLQHGLRSIQWPNNAHEPDYVAKLVDVLPDLISHSLAHIMPGGKYAVGSAFIHQKPIAHFLSKSGYKNPELGDLLIVCRDKRFSCYAYNAILLQAKCADNHSCVKILNDHQYILYSEWPEFEYKRAGILNGKKRGVLPKSITQGAQYLLIERDNRDDSSDVRLFTATVDRPLSASMSFAGSLLLSFNTGRSFQFSRPRDDWSQMILDLLRLSADAKFNRRNSHYVGAQRWNGDSSFLYLLNTKDTDRELIERYSPKGMGVICIDLDFSRDASED